MLRPRLGPLVAFPAAIPARLDGRTVAEVERSFAPARVFAERLRTPEGIVDPTRSTVLRTGQVLALSGRLATQAGPENPLAGTEVDDPELLDIPTGTVFRGVLPFIGADVVRLALLVAFPAITLYLTQFVR